MAKVWFRCDGRNARLFTLNQTKELDYIPMVGDEIETSTEDFVTASFRIKPWSKTKDKHSEFIRNSTFLNFTVKSRKYTLSRNEWELICEPTPKSLIFLLSSVKV